MVLEIRDKVFDTLRIKNLLRQGENNVDTVQFSVKRYYNGLDLSTLSYVLYGDSRANTRASVELEQEIQEDKLTLIWNITKDFTAVPGTLTLLIKGYNTQKQEVIKFTGYSPIEVKKTDPNGATIVPPESEYDQALEKLYQILEEAKEVSMYPPRIGENDNWEVYNNVLNEYVDTGISVRGAQPKGEWSASATYQKLDIVSYQGSSFAVLKEITGIVPTNDNINYMLIAQKGDVGKSAYEYAKESGFVGTEQEFAQAQSDILNAKNEVESVKEEVSLIQTQVNQSATQVSNDKQVVETARQDVSLKHTEVLEKAEQVKTSVESFDSSVVQAKEEIETSKTNAIQEINRSGEAAKQSVIAEGTNQTQSVTNAGTQSVANVQSKATEQLNLIANAGTTEVQKVATEGAKQAEEIKAIESLLPVPTAQDAGKVPVVDAAGTGYELQKVSGSGGNEPIYTYQDMELVWERGMCLSNGTPNPDIEGFYTLIPINSGDKLILNGYAQAGGYFTLQMEKGYNQQIMQYLKCQDGSSILDYYQQNMRIEGLKVECIKAGKICINSKAPSTIQKLVEISLPELIQMIPTKISQLENDSEFVDSAKLQEVAQSIPTKVSQLENDSQFLNAESAKGIINRQIGNSTLQIYHTVYGIVGREQQIFKYSIFNTSFKNALYVKMQGAYNFPRYLNINSLPEGNTVVDMEITNNNNISIDKKTVTFKAKRPENPATPKNILFIGDSRTYSGDMVTEVSRMLSGTKGEATAPTTFGLENYRVVGRRKSKFDARVGFEGNSGWTTRTYALWGVNSLALSVSEALDLKIGATYTYTAANGKQATVMIEEIDGNSITCDFPGWSQTSSAPAEQKGTMQKASGEGAEILEFTAFSEGKYSPFLRNGEVDFKIYADKYCDSQLDCVCIWLGINDLIGISENTDQAIDFVINDFIVKYLKIMIDKIFEQFPACKVLLGSEILPSQNGGLSTSVQAQYSSIPEGMNYIIYKTNQAYIKLAEQYENCFYLDNNCQFDAENGYETINKPVNLRDPKTEKVGNNNVHPTKYGYWQQADSFTRAIINLI